MSWFSKIFARPIAAPNVPSAETLGSRNTPAAEAKHITTENVREWCNRLEREGQRTGNVRLITQARNIRIRHRL